MHQLNDSELEKMYLFQAFSAHFAKAVLFFRFRPSFRIPYLGPYITQFMPFKVHF
jgi:hypothetical protein